MTATDPDGLDAALVADWSVLSAPPAAGEPRFDPDASTTTVTFDQAGDYRLAVHISDPTGLSVEVEVLVTSDRTPTDMPMPP